MRFSLTTASGDSFCNREQERNMLMRCMLDSQHVWIQAPRRYGKTSLVRQAVKELQAKDKKVLFVPLDFMLCGDVHSCINKLLTGISATVNASTANVNSVIGKLASVFSRANFAINDGKMNLSLTQKPNLNVDDLETSLMGFDTWLSQQKAKAVMYLDEFQNIGIIDKSFTLEATIRACAQSTNNISFVFSGSNRHLMEQAMGDIERPLYHHCQPIKIDRISEKSYRQHIQLAASETWQCSIDNDIINTIFMLTKRHAYYTSALCQRLFYQKNKPNLSAVMTHWQDLVETDMDTIKAEMQKMNANMKKALVYIAKSQEPVQKVNSSAFSQATNIKAGSLANTIDKLHWADHIEMHKDGWRLVNPALEFHIKTSAF